MKKISTYLPLYIGRTVSWLRVQDQSTQIGVATISDLSFLIEQPCLKLFLRPISDLSGKEKLKIADLIGSYNRFTELQKIIMVSQLFENNGFTNKISSISGSTWNEILLYMRKCGIDVDGLIEAGLATKTLGVNFEITERNCVDVIKQMIEKIPAEQKLFIMALDTCKDLALWNQNTDMNPWKRTMDVVIKYIPEPKEEWEFEVLHIFSTHSITELKEFYLGPQQTV